MPRFSDDRANTFDDKLKRMIVREVNSGRATIAEVLAPLMTCMIDIVDKAPGVMRAGLLNSLATAITLRFPDVLISIPGDTDAKH